MPLTLSSIKRYCVTTRRFVVGYPFLQDGDLAGDRPFLRLLLRRARVRRPPPAALPGWGSSVPRSCGYSFFSNDWVICAGLLGPGHLGLGRRRQGRTSDRGWAEVPHVGSCPGNPWPGDWFPTGVRHGGPGRTGEATDGMKPTLLRAGLAQPCPRFPPVSLSILSPRLRCRRVKLAGPPQATLPLENRRASREW